jgi:cephalosporin hydroxylase
MDPLEILVTNLFHVMYYNSPHTWNQSWTKWLGTACLQNPLDMWIIQEVISAILPEVIIETGSAAGGSALYFAMIYDQLYRMKLVDGKIISIDMQDRMSPKGVSHPRITFIKGKSTDKKIVDRVKHEIKGKKSVMVILDSDHTMENVLAEIKAYSPMVTHGSYMVVCDTNLGGNPVQHFECPPPGPMGAVIKFMTNNKDWEVDLSGEKFYMTFHPKGFLRKK